MISTKIRYFQNFILNWINEPIFKSLLPNIKGKVVDLGCGEKQNRDILLRYADEYIGIDWENSLHNVKPDIYADLNKYIPLEKENIDSAVAISVMEHLKEPLTFLKEVNRILKPGGYFIIQVPFQWWIHEAPYDYFRYTPYGLRYLLEKVNFKVYKIIPAGGFFTTITLKINYFSVHMFKLPKFLWILWLLFLSPFWIINQLIAYFLDRLDKNPELESQGFWVLACKDTI